MLSKNREEEDATHLSSGYYKGTASCYTKAKTKHGSTG